jgi:hypothetical protein
VDASIQASDTPTMARLAISPMISRAFMFSPYDQKCDGEYDQPKKHPAQNGSDSFGNGDGVVVFH